MKITENQGRNIQLWFTLLFAINIGFSIWNIVETHKSRQLERTMLSERIKSIRNGNNKKDNDDDELNN